jgi:hypothetical protein
VKGHANHLNHDRGKCKHLNIIADEMCDIIRDEALGPMGAHAYNALYMPSLGYGPCATTLTWCKCEDIQCPVVNVILPKHGIKRKSSRSVIFGTAQFGGLGLEHLATAGSGKMRHVLYSLDASKS